MIDRQRDHPALIRCIQPMSNVPCPRIWDLVLRTTPYNAVFGSITPYGANNWAWNAYKTADAHSHTACVK